MRLQRMLFRVQAYDLLVHYNPDKYLYTADTLSRATLKCDIFKNKLDCEIEIHVDLLLSHIPISNKQILNFKTKLIEMMYLSN